ncbi:uncharacterized protein MONBRDRAFT_24906 [Monosiga brevicollis MX1]|uniref:G-protein coupled receptors family 3 profile domain-containing protein n=1 Tax=Monosiga brevicollis TaxID=81824 RepID=A9UY37_MONBE|nr:uncharacterized protein MONBRDRAFT_24906 [Monosiga brevicollis MX1]EDQ89952.1 predicted protein [Monosiga brevicollis MX1]|eukprot:XP_001745374.1 hypothetical protein [Monosiga brevicollis MX1]
MQSSLHSTASAPFVPPSPPQAPNVTTGFPGEYTLGNGSTECIVATNRGQGRTDFSTCTTTAATCGCLEGRVAPDCKQIPVYLDYDDGVAILLEVMSALGQAMAVACGLYLIRHRAHPIVRGTSLTFCLLILFGILIGLSAVWALIGEPSRSKCTLFHFMEGIYFAFIMANLLVKTWRIYKIFFFTFDVDKVLLRYCSPLAERSNFRALPRSLSEGRMISRALLAIFFEACIIGLFALIYPIGTQIDDVEADEFGKRRLLCQDGIEVKIVTLLINLVYLGAGFSLAFKTRTIRTDQFSESSFVIVMLLFSGVIVPAVALTLGMVGLARQYFNICAIWVTCILTLASVFGPKIFGIMFDESFTGTKWRFTSHTDSSEAEESSFGPFDTTGVPRMATSAISQYSDETSRRKISMALNPSICIDSINDGTTPHRAKSNVTFSDLNEAAVQQHFKSVVDQPPSTMHAIVESETDSDSSSDADDVQQMGKQAGDAEGDDAASISGSEHEFELSADASEVEVQDFVGHHRDIVNLLARLVRECEGDEVLSLVETTFAVAVGDVDFADLAEKLHGPRERSRDRSFRHAQKSLRSARRSHHGAQSRPRPRLAATKDSAASKSFDDRLLNTEHVQAADLAGGLTTHVARQRLASEAVNRKRSVGRTKSRNKEAHDQAAAKQIQLEYRAMIFFVDKRRDFEMIPGDVIEDLEFPSDSLLAIGTNARTGKRGQFPCSYLAHRRLAPTPTPTPAAAPSPSNRVRRHSTETVGSESADRGAAHQAHEDEAVRPASSSNLLGGLADSLSASRPKLMKQRSVPDGEERIQTIRVQSPDASDLDV